jgi:hypothetical protein
MLKLIPFLLIVAAAAFAQDSPNDETEIWKLEKAYWEYVRLAFRPHRFFTPKTLFLPRKNRILMKWK